MTDLLQAAREMDTLRDENASLRLENQDIRSNAQNLLDELQSLRTAAKQALSERDYYMRECAELVGRFQSFCGIARDAIEQYRMAPFRPNGAVPNEPAIAEVISEVAKGLGVEEPIPAFLTNQKFEERKCIELPPRTEPSKPRRRNIT